MPSLLFFAFWRAQSAFASLDLLGLAFSLLAACPSFAQEASKDRQDKPASASTKDVAKQVWVCELNLESDSSTRLFTLPQLSSAGSLCLSPDQKRFAFDGLYEGETRLEKTQIFISNLDGSELHDLGPGALPSWAPDSKLLSVSRYSAGGVWLMNLDGEFTHCVAQNGWGGRWSPVAKELLFTGRGPNGQDFIIYNVDEDSYREVFGAKGHPYQRLVFNSEWSSKADRIFFKATRKDGSSEISSVSVAVPQDIRVHFLRNSYANIGLLSDDEFVVPYGAKQFGTVQLHRIKISGAAPVTDDSGKHIAGQFTDRNSFGCAISADRKKIYYISVPKTP